MRRSVSHTTCLMTRARQRAIEPAARRTADAVLAVCQRDKTAILGYITQRSIQIADLSYGDSTACSYHLTSRPKHGTSIRTLLYQPHLAGQWAKRRERPGQRCRTTRSSSPWDPRAERFSQRVIPEGVRKDRGSDRDSVGPGPIEDYHERACTQEVLKRRRAPSAECPWM